MTHGDDALFTVDEANLVAGNIGSGAALTKVDDTNITLTLSANAPTALLKATSITVGWTGTLAAARLNANVVQSVVNDTNVTGSIAAQALTLGWTGRLAYSRFTQGSALSVLGVAGNAGADHASIVAASDGHVLRRSGTTVGFGPVDLAGASAVTGDLPLGNIVPGAALSVLGVTGNATADHADIVAGTDGHVLRRSGAAVSFGQIATAGIADAAVTYAKIQDVSATNRVLGRITAGAGDVEELTPTQVTTLVDLFTSTLKGAVPASGGGTTNFLRADGTFAAPPGGGLSDGDKGDITVGGSGTTLTIDAGAVTTTKIADDAVDNTKLANMAAATFKMRALGAGSGDPIDGTAAQAKAALALVAADIPSLAYLPLVGGGSLTAGKVNFDCGVTGTDGIGVVTSNLGEIEVRGNAAGTGAAMMAFHRPTAHAAYFGLDTDNQFKVGGWSMGAVARKIFHEGNLTTFTSSVAGLVPASGGGTANFLRADGTFAAPAGGGSSFPAGTAMLFVQTAAPTGWTKQTGHNDKALRIVSGAVTSGGSSPFSTVFGKTATDSTTLSTSTVPAQSHTFKTSNVDADSRTTSNIAGGTGDGYKFHYTGANNQSIGTAVTDSNTGGGHTHPMDIRVQYLDVIYATKD